MPSLTIQQAIDLGLQHHRAGRLAQAEQIYRQVLAQQPNHPWAIQLLGMIAHQVGNSKVAIDLLRRAIAIDPNVADFHNNFGEILRTAGKLDEAETHLLRCIQLNPNFAAAYSNLGEIYRERKQLPRAAELYRKAIALDPDSAASHNNLGIATHDMGDPHAAIELYHRALALSNGNYPDAVNNLATSLLDLRRIDEAIDGFRKAIVANPNNADAHSNLSHALLMKGDFEAGWEEYEWRWQCPQFPSPRRNFPQPLWNGEDPAGKRILVHSEQGLGDAVNFVRYVPLLKARGATVILESKPEVHELFRSVEGYDQLVCFGEPLPDFDWQIPMLSLPRAFKTTLATIPAAVPYLRADERPIEAWRQKLGDRDGTLRVGLNWAGSPSQGIDQFRSLHLNRLAPLAEAKSVTFHSLQKGYAAAQTSTPPPGVKLIDHSAELTDFSQTAALMMNLDLVISTCTSVPHVAGALGRPVWIMLPFNCDWRWMTDPDSTPWYPTMRLFRQEKFGDWDGAITRVTEELRREIRRTKPE